jgi:tetratricopeptide (TPR) repeat protein
MATAKSNRESEKRKAKRNFFLRFFSTIAVFFIFAEGIAVAENSPQQKFAARAEAELQRAQKQFQTDESNPTNAWKFAKACYDMADFATNDSQRAELANEGIDVCRRILAQNSKIAEAHYYLAMNLGQLARTKSLGALKLVREMETEFKAALNLNPQIDFGGPARSLGLLYRDAPGWPMSIGSKRKAKMYLQQALQIAPDFPENILVMAESDLKWDDRADAQKQLDALNSLWPKAQKEFSGENHERDWADWTARRDAVRKKLGEVSTPLKSPRGGQ